MKFKSCTRINEQINSFLNLWNIAFEKQNRSGQWTLASRRTKPLIQEVIDTGEPVDLNEIKADAVQIIPFVKYSFADEKLNYKTLIAIREFRIPVGNWEYSFPAGLIDENETPVEAAKRELLEETGYSIKKVYHISPPLFTSSGLSDETIVTVMAEVEKVKDANLEFLEQIEVLEIDKEQAINLAQGNKGFHGAYISARAWPFFLLFTEG